MSTPTDPTSVINQALVDPASASNDGQSVSSRSVGDIIKASQFQAQIQANNSALRGIRLAKFIPEGPFSDNGASYADNLFINFGGGGW